MMRTFLDAVVAMGASVELLLVLKATVALALGLTAVRIVRSGRASVRHLLLLVTFGALMALPIAPLVIPAVRIEIPTRAAATPVASSAPAPDQAIVTTRAVDQGTAVPGAPGFWVAISAQTLFQILWASGALLFFVSFANGLWQLRRIRRSGVPWLEVHAELRALAAASGVSRPIELMLHDNVAAPITSGLWRPAILMPADARDWSKSDVRRALVHELEHIRRGDWTFHILARLLCALYWFHPLVWVAWRRLCLEAERACDDAVLQEAERTDYAEQLVLLARRLSSAMAPPALSMANRSDLSSRVSAILDSNQSRGRVGWIPAALALVSAIAVVSAIGPLRAVHAVVNANATPATGQKPAVSGSNRLNRALLEAAEDGDVAEITRLLDAGADVNATFDGDGTALIVAAREGRLPVVQLLLVRGANVNTGVPGDGNALIMAAREGHEEAVKLLLDRGANIDQVVPGDENALIQASGEGHLNIVKLLVSRGADVNARVMVSHNRNETSSELRTPLTMARKGGHKAVIDFLLSTGARE